MRKWRMSAAAASMAMVGLLAGTSPAAAGPTVGDPSAPATVPVGKAPEPPPMRGLRHFTAVMSLWTPRPWHTWELQVTDPAATVLEITGVGAWAAFVERYAAVHSGAVFPDWDKVAHDYAGVHVTLRAILATQGFRFAVKDGLTAPPYWDIESVLWLRWCFSSVRLVEVTPAATP
ncbi:hypothetical protein [Streptomyces melanogenes]|uniref:hypothetical protein n=1 Tax=Streptomyces melanogenes TaxID=67326 RepID=UPI0037A70BEB